MLIYKIKIYLNSLLFILVSSLDSYIFVSFIVFFYLFQIKEDLQS